jgi:hypothetical protein
VIQRHSLGSTEASFQAIGYVVALGALVLGCTNAEAVDAATEPDPWTSLADVTHPDAELSRLGARGATLQRICERRRGDSFARALCDRSKRLELSDMAGLLQLAGLGAQRAFALTGNSTSLVAKSVSAINPRILVFPRVGPDLEPPPTMTAVGFVRGEQFVEIASRDLASGDLNFYLLSFEQRCSYDPAGCDLANLLTEEIEHGWTAYSVYDQDDLEGTSFDCLSCHQPGGFGSKRILRMQELASPWLHWFPQRFVQRTDSDRVLGSLFADTHQRDSQYGGVPLATITSAVDEGGGALLEALVSAEGFRTQPNVFDAQIAREASQGVSQTWQARFDTHLQGNAIAVPYPLLDVSDAAKRTAAANSYKNVVAGLAPRQSLLDIREIFSDDASTKLSFSPRADAPGKTVLLQMCGRCHDGRGNPALSKNQFNVLKLDALPRSGKDAAIARLNAPSDQRMPPWRVAALTPQAIQAATQELQK